MGDDVRLSAGCAEAWIYSLPIQPGLDWERINPDLPPIQQPPPPSSFTHHKVQKCDHPLPNMHQQNHPNHTSTEHGCTPNMTPETATNQASLNQTTIHLAPSPRYRPSQAFLHLLQNATLFISHQICTNLMNSLSHDKNLMSCNPKFMQTTSS